MKNKKYIMVAIGTIVLLTGCLAKPVEQTSTENTTTEKVSTEEMSQEPDSTTTTEEAKPARPLEQGEALYLSVYNGAFADIDNNMPVKITIRVDRMGSTSKYVITEEDVIQNAVELFKEITIAGDGYSVTDNYNTIIFEYEDGTTSSLSFEMWYLVATKDGQFHNYELSGIQEFVEYVYNNAEN